MTSPIRLLFISATASILLGCGTASEMTETQKKSDSTALELEREFGVKPLVGWKVQNGTLIHVDVQFPADSVAKLPVSELVGKVRIVVTKNFEKSPQQLVVSAISKQ